MSEESRQNYIPFTEPKPVTTVQGAEYAESVSPGGLIVLSETQAAPRSPVAYIPPFQQPYAYASYVSEAIQSTDTKFRSVKMNMLSPEAKVIYRKF